jgi:hypothetical protein
MPDSRIAEPNSGGRPEGDGATRWHTDHGRASQPAPRLACATPTLPRPQPQRTRHTLSSLREQPNLLPDWRRLADYIDVAGRRREVVAAAAHAGSILVIDRELESGGDRRLLAHLAADEPPENALLICADYLDNARGDSRRCRAVADEDTCLAPPSDYLLATLEPPPAAEPCDSAGCSYSIAPLPGRMSIPELRWCRRETSTSSAAHIVSLREAIARIESYGPLCLLTEHALVRHRDDCQVSSTVLRAELRRVRDSPIVLNRRLREEVLERIAARGPSMSEIATRCGRVKRDRRGNESGETSWLARRLGLLAEGGQSAPTPWIHTDVLALIARRGLGLSPREVETP